jgi:hypothetical protein
MLHPALPTGPTQGSVAGFGMDVLQENPMRMLLSFALVFVMAGSAQAQQTQPATTGDVPAAEAVTTQAPAPVNLQKQTTQLRTVEPTERPSGQATSSVVVEATNAAYADAVLQQNVGTRSWWYLVAAIVVAGIILAVLL